MGGYLDEILDNIINECREDVLQVENKKRLLKDKTALTGDTHGNGLARFKSIKNSGCSEIIVCGDFGYVWNNIKENNYYLNILNNYGYKILFLDGNHENFDELEKYPFENMFGAKVQVLRDNVIHLLRGEIYQISNNKIFVMGGAASTDKKYRVKGESWWPQEIPNKKERDRALENLKINNNKVDIILTHTAPSSVLKLMNADYRCDEFTDFLEYININVQFNHWYFGHMHINQEVDDKYICLYDSIIYL